MNPKSLENLQSFDSDTAKEAAQKSAEARYVGNLVMRSFKIRKDQAEWLKGQKNASELIREAIDRKMKQSECK